MKNVVYILGAGFSAPLGLPTMSDFWEKSTDMIATDKQTYGRFSKIIEKIKQTSLASNIFEYERFNIEEALSILEFSEQPGVMSQTKKEFVEFIIAVIKFYTPGTELLMPETAREPLPRDHSPGWIHSPFDDIPKRWRTYVKFVASLLNFELSDELVDFNGQVIREIRPSRRRNESVSYSIITLNYDMILELVCGYLNSRYCMPNEEIARFSDDLSDGHANPTDCLLLKLHGSVGEREIAPPTFIKALYLQTLSTRWTLAWRLLSKANEVRILGYSLPQTDAYMKFLLKSSIGSTLEVNKIDIICRDTSGRARTGYEQFIQTKRNFVSGSVEKYLDGFVGRVTARNPRAMPEERLSSVTFDGLEKAHFKFMQDAEKQQ